MRVLVDFAEEGRMARASDHRRGLLHLQLYSTLSDMLARVVVGPACVCALAPIHREGGGVCCRAVWSSRSLSLDADTTWQRETPRYGVWTESCSAPA